MWKQPAYVPAAVARIFNDDPVLTILWLEALKSVGGHTVGDDDLWARMDRWLRVYPIPIRA